MSECRGGGGIGCVPFLMLIFLMVWVYQTRAEVREANMTLDQLTAQNAMLEQRLADLESTSPEQSP